MVFEALRVCSRSLPLIFTVLVTGSAAEDLRAPVNVAIELYRGCLVGKAMSGGSATKAELKNQKFIQNYIQRVDEDCITWTAVWAPTLTGRNIETWPKSTLKRFEDRRAWHLQSFANEFIQVQ